MFGEWGGIILQFTITIVVVLGLVALVYWLVRRYSSGGLGRIGRGRVPRLAIIDAMAVDGRRRLVLIRRDNVEHLILIGGPSDVVVEQTIQRPRQRQAPRPQTPSVETPAEPPAVVTDNPPIPFPQTRVQPAASASAAPAPAYRPEPFQPAPTAPAPAYQSPAAAAPAAQYQPPQPQPIERPFSPIRRTQAAPRPEPAPVTPPAPATVVQFEPMVDTAPMFPELPPVEPAQDEEPPAFIRRLSEANGEAAPFDFGSNGSTSPFAVPETDNSAETAAKVNDLEREMARLLGEITAKRPS